MSDLRDTKYAKELARAVLALSDEEEARLERLHVKERDTQEIRFSWWKAANILPRPLDLEETDLLALIEEGIRECVFSDEFLQGLRELIQT